MSNSVTNDNINCQFESLGIIQFDHLSKMSLCKLGHKGTHKHIPMPVLLLFENFGGKKHINTQLEIGTYEMYKNTMTANSTEVSYVKA